MIRFLVIWSLALTVWSVIRPADYAVWLFEIFAGVAGVAVLALTSNRFRFSPLVYVLVAVHFAILAIAAKYTYAEMPLFNWLRDDFGLARNYYDRIGHFFQGFVPALIAREFLLRLGGLRPGKVLTFLCISIALAIAAFWELLEWWVVIVFYPGSGPEWLGTQGDVWDAQSDMFMAFLGGILASTLLTGAHDRSLRKVSPLWAKTSASPARRPGPRDLREP